MNFKPNRINIGVGFLSAGAVYVLLNYIAFGQLRQKVPIKELWLQLLPIELLFLILGFIGGSIISKGAYNGCCY